MRHIIVPPNGAPADDSKELARVGPGQCFGEMALLSGDTRAANVMALDNSEVSEQLPACRRHKRTGTTCRC